MTGPQHYAEAERLLGGDEMDMAAAQVHATLALVAASVEAEVTDKTRISQALLWAEVTR